VTHPLASSEIVLLGYKSPNMNSPDIPALEVAAAVLATGESSLLQQALIEKNIASAVSASNYSLRYPGLFQIEAQGAPGRSADEILKIIKENIDKLKNSAIDENQLVTAKNQFLLSSYNDLASDNSIAEALGEALVSSDNYRRGFEILESVKSVTSADVKRVANTYFVDTQSSTLVLSPEKQK
jgi:zinc protease